MLHHGDRQSHCEKLDLERWRKGGHHEGQPVLTTSQAAF